MAVVTVLQFGLILAVLVYLTLNMIHLVKAEPATGLLPEAPFISVCVPARNEERDLEACLVSLLEQDHPKFEVIVVDDHSTDRTPEIIADLQARYPRLIAVQSEELPPDWYGKSHALHQAAQAAQGDWLLFTDADPVFRPFALSTAAHLIVTRKLDFLSLMPGTVFGSFWERVVQPIIFAFIAALTRFKKVNSTQYDSAMGVGAFIMIRRDWYDRLGGHVPLKQTILEDIGMAKMAKQAGARSLIADAKDIYSIRMYHSLGEIWNGWRKNVFLAFRKSVVKTLYFAFVVLAFTVTPWVLVLYHLAAGSPLWQTGLSLLGLCLVLFAEAALCEELRLEKRYVFLFPLGALVTVAIMINSMIHILLHGKAEWRGRTYTRPT